MGRPRVDRLRMPIMVREVLFRYHIEKSRLRNHNLSSSQSNLPPLESPPGKPQAARELEAKLSHIERLLGSDPAMADRQASDLLAVVPGQPMALLFQGIARRLMGDPAGAIEVLGPLCRNEPNAPLPQLQLGLAQREAEDGDAAVQSMRRAVAARPDFSDAWLALADLLIAREDRKGADEAFGMYIRHSARDPILTACAAALRDERIHEAESMLRNHLQQHPTDVAAMCMLADVAVRQDRLSEAEALLASCLELAPSYTWARHNHAVVLLRQNNAIAARRESDLALATEPRNPEFRKLRAAILVRLLEYDESIGICRALLDEDPNQPTVWTSLGHMLKSVGRREECVEAYRRAIEIAPRFGEPYWSLANLKTFKMSDAELAAMRTQLQEPDLGGENLTHFHFAMGKALEDRREFAESFEHYAEGNRIRLQRAPYNAEELSEHVQRSKALFTESFFRERQGLGAGASDPIFIVGLPRSGSTLVEQILASHSAVEGTMELPEIATLAKWLDDLKAGPNEPKYPEVLGDLGDEALRELGESYIERTRVHRKLGTPLFIDKMPNNFAHVGLIHLVLPNARIIDARRHPLACGLSVFKEHFARAQNFSYSLEDIGRYYRNYVELMAHFDAVLPGRVHRVIYESLVDDTDAQVRALLEYCGLPFEDSCLRFYENKRAVSTASAEQVRTPIFRNAVSHWRNYEPWMGPLKAELGPVADSYPAIPDLS